jgi:Coenzyme PQQ synthesis protein D (PqqD)
VGYFLKYPEPIAMIRSREERPLRLQSKSMILEQLQHELMIYDPEQNKAFCLNHTAAFVWKRADGKTTVAEMAKNLGYHSDRPIPENEKLVAFALEVLSKDGLLVSSTFVPSAILGLTRRRMLQQVGAGAMAVPAVTALFVPPAKGHAFSASSTIPSSDLPATTPNYGPGFWKWIEDLF